VLPNGSFVTFHYSSYGTFSVHSKSSIISTVVLPTTEIIEPFFCLKKSYNDINEMIGEENHAKSLL
ncbi:hypothetical protein J7U03_05190, partial [Streptococcus thermophilus]